MIMSGTLPDPVKDKRGFFQEVLHDLEPLGDAVLKSSKRRSRRSAGRPGRQGKAPARQSPRSDPAYRQETGEYVQWTRRGATVIFSKYGGTEFKLGTDRRS